MQRDTPKGHNAVKQKIQNTMATISFTNTDAPDVSPAKDLAVVKPAEVAVAPSRNSGGSGIEGEITARDVSLPRLNLVQKTGGLADNYSPGAFILNKEIQICAPKESFTGTALRLKKSYQQKLVYGAPEQPLRANTSEEVRALGGSLIYGHDNYWQDVADILMAVKAPKDLKEDDLNFFPYEFGGDNYAVAIYTVASSSYTSLAKRIITDGSQLLKAGLYTGQYSITSDLRRNGANSWWVPVPEFAGKHSAEGQEFFRGLAGL